MVGTASGCGSMQFSYHAKHAEKHLEQARQIDAQTLAPYEYELARLHMEKAREEAGRAEYGDAVDLAKIADESALGALETARQRRAQASDGESEH